jgi:pantetheine-phosphate adenylyltransferase
MVDTIQKIAIFPGSFDPPTLGHMDVLHDASELFDHVVWAIGYNPEKSSGMFTIDERLEMMNKANVWKNVSLEKFDTLTVAVAKKFKARYMIRSMRMTMDFEYEMQLAMINTSLDSDIKTIYFPPCQANLHISSTAARELIKRNLFDELYDFLPETIISWLKLRSHRNENSTAF